MEKVNVLVGWGMLPPFLERIAAVDPRVRLLNDPSMEIPRPLVAPPFPFPDQLLALVPQAEVMFTSRLPPELPKRAPLLRWVQLYSAGADVVLRQDLSGASILFTTASGVHPIPLTEWVLGAMIALVKDFPGAVRAQRERRYWQFVPGELADRTAGILGLGNVGLRVAEMCKAFGMRVLAVRRSVTEPLERQGPADLLLPPRDMPRLLAESDFVIVCLPGTRETRGLLGAEELAQMKPGSYLINAGRGGIVDEEALVRALRSGRLAGAALDVFTREPLPPESPLWDEPKLLLTAHVAGNSPRYEERATELFLENLRRYLDGRELLNVYDAGRGY